MKLRIALWLVALSVVPLLGGVARLAGMAGVDGQPMDARFVQSPMPALVHILAASLFSVLGAFQFESRLRQAWPRWHRVAGRLVMLCGLLAATTGVWMTLAYVIPPELQGRILFWVRLAVGSGMALALVLALQAIRGGKVPSHTTWMLRAYALGQGASTQVLFLLPPQLLSGEAVTGLPRDLLMTAAWAANLFVAESIRRQQESKSLRVAAGTSARCDRDPSVAEHLGSPAPPDLVHPRGGTTRRAPHHRRRSPDASGPRAASPHSSSAAHPAASGGTP